MRRSVLILAVAAISGLIALAILTLGIVVDISPDLHRLFLVALTVSGVLTLGAWFDRRAVAVEAAFNHGWRAAVRIDRFADPNEHMVAVDPAPTRE